MAKDKTGTISFYDGYAKVLNHYKLELKMIPFGFFIHFYERDWELNTVNPRYSGHPRDVVWCM